jgi:hypothetical protein
MQALQARTVAHVDEKYVRVSRRDMIEGPAIGYVQTFTQAFACTG